MKELNIESIDYLLGLVSILPWVFAIWFSYSLPKTNKTRVMVLVALALGWLSTVIIIWLHPILWPQTDFTPKKKVSLLTSTAHLSFIEAGMMEETFKIGFILILSFLFAFRREKKEFRTEVVLIAAFVAFGFALTENIQYISREQSMRKFEMFLGRLTHSSNIHLLINVCFALFLLKSNAKKGKERLYYLLFAFFIAIMQHGVVDFLLIPGSIFGMWVATALFVGIWVWVVKDWRLYVKAQVEDKNTLIPASEYSSQSY
ncbi:protease PrsW family protein [Leptospira ryugenii]|uniref:Protease PrsW family protein n=1 Tax=Leptospira ryugenii TaxID=1917863 RepID=A0A2P2DZ77_9LEPT|nr:PrsW family glutamic-type intramembrane protease [Leptospira ryugenii]GBF49931.1 protease PrsW family protein [Leptospira ryugenii]